MYIYFFIVDDKIICVRPFFYNNITAFGQFLILSTLGKFLFVLLNATLGKLFTHTCLCHEAV